MRRYIGIDCGATNTKVVVIDTAGQISQVLVHHTNSSQKSLLLKQLSEVIATIQQCAPEIEICIGIGFPGLVDTNQQVARWLPNYSGKFTISKVELHNATSCNKIDIDNDLNMAIFSEYCLRHLKSQDVLLFCSVGTGFGYSVMLNGDIFRGSRGYANQIGHSAMLALGEKCTCGRNGCLELNIIPWRNPQDEDVHFRLGTHIGLLVNCYNPNILILDVDRSNKSSAQSAIFAGIQQASIGFILDCVRIEKSRCMQFSGAMGAALFSMSRYDPHSLGEVVGAINRYDWHLAGLQPRPK